MSSGPAIGPQWLSHSIAAHGPHSECMDALRGQLARWLCRLESTAARLLLYFRSMSDSSSPTDQASPATTQPIHVSVMPREIIEWLRPSAGSILLDGTLGAGGHTRLLAEAIDAAENLAKSTGNTQFSPGYVLSSDRDEAALARAEVHLKGLPVKLVHANFCELPSVLEELGVTGVQGCVLDLGLSSDQLADDARGFSFDATGELDLRFDTSTGDPAWKLLEKLREEEIANIIYQFGEERLSRRIARKICEQRIIKPIRTADELARIVRRCVPRGDGKIDPATRTFQALRIAVNGELDALKKALEKIPECLAPGGRLAIISFHSLEDRLVKEAFRSDLRLNNLTKKPLTALDDELASNPRSRSAKLRVAERV